MTIVSVGVPLLTVFGREDEDGFAVSRRTERIASLGKKEGVS